MCSINVNAEFHYALLAASQSQVMDPSIVVVYELLTMRLPAQPSSDSIELGHFESAN